MSTATDRQIEEHATQSPVFLISFGYGLITHIAPCAFVVNHFIRKTMPEMSTLKYGFVAAGGLAAGFNRFLLLPPGTLRLLTHAFAHRRGNSTRSALHFRTVLSLLRPRLTSRSGSPAQCGYRARSAPRRWPTTGGAGGLYLPHHWQHVRREGIRGHPVRGSAFGLCLIQIGSVPQARALRQPSFRVERRVVPRSQLPVPRPWPASRQTKLPAWRSSDPSARIAAPGSRS